MFKIENLSTTLHHKKVLDNISLEVGHGQLAILLGPSGVGKSTLLRAMNNLAPVDQGVISLDGKALDITQINKTHTIGMVFQHFNLFENMTALENISVVLEHVIKADKQTAQAQAQELLIKYGLHDYTSRYPSQLSGGQKQRLALARTLATKPQVVCLDEPTSALDPLLTKAVADTIKELVENNYCVIVATHDLGLVKQLKGTLYLMHEGSVVESAYSSEYYAHSEKFHFITAFMHGEKSSITSGHAS